MDTNSGPWFTCLNVGDDYEAKADRRKDQDLTIPAYSLVEIVGVKLLGKTTDNISSADHFVLEVRLPTGETAEGQEESPDENGVVPTYVTMGRNFAFTGPASIGKLKFGKLTYPPCLCRFEGDENDTAKIQGRYVRPKTSKLSDATLDTYEELFSGGTFQQLIGDPKGHLKLPNDLPKASKYKLQAQLLGWNALGVYKFRTGEKTRGKPDDKDSSKNLLVMVAPAAQVEQRPSVRFVTLEPYTTYVVKTYASGSYDLDGDSRAGQEYTVMVDGDEPIQVALQYREDDGNHKQLVSFVGDNISGSVKLTLGEYETAEISLSESTLTAAYLKEKLEALPQIGTGNLNVTLYPGRWLIEFAGDLAGQSFETFKVDIPEAAVFEVHVLTTKWTDAGVTIDLHYPIPLAGTWDTDDEVVVDAVAPGSFGTAQYMPGIGYVSDLNECRDYHDGSSPVL